MLETSTTDNATGRGLVRLAANSRRDIGLIATLLHLRLFLVLLIK